MFPLCAQQIEIGIYTIANIFSVTIKRYWREQWWRDDLYYGKASVHHKTCAICHKPSKCHCHLSFIAFKPFQWIWWNCYKAFCLLLDAMLILTSHHIPCRVFDTRRRRQSKGNVLVRWQKHAFKSHQCRIFHIMMSIANTRMLQAILQNITCMQ